MRVISTIACFLGALVFGAIATLLLWWIPRWARRIGETLAPGTDPHFTHVEVSRISVAGVELDSAWTQVIAYGCAALAVFLLIVAIWGAFGSHAQPVAE